LIGEDVRNVQDDGATIVDHTGNQEGHRSLDQVGISWLKPSLSIGELIMNAKLDFIGLVVEDMARSLAFYRHLGLELPPEADRQPHVEIALAGGLRIGWDTVETIRSFDPDWQPASGGPGVGFAFRLTSPAEVDEAYERLVALGYHGHRAPWDAVWGQRYASVHDPDGNGVDLFCELAGAAPDAEPVS
jgi:catechol 2,3-dioxygenase-like lactoylglutathione lyase family enzyme